MTRTNILVTKVRTGTNPKKETDHDKRQMEETLYDLANHYDLGGFWSRLTALPRSQAISELLHRDSHGATALHYLMASDPPLELLRVISDVMKNDPSKTNLFTIANARGSYPLHRCALKTTRVEVLQFVTDKFPHALVRRNQWGNTPLFLARTANHAAIVRCVEDNTANYPALLNQLTVKCCMVRLKNQGMTAVVAATPLNEQTRGQFVYELLDLMVNSEMKAMAEDILSYVGKGKSMKEYTTTTGTTPTHEDEDEDDGRGGDEVESDSASDAK